MLLVPKSNPKMCFCIMVFVFFFKAMVFFRQNLSFHLFLLLLPYKFEANHNKDYSVVKTLGSLVL